MCILECLRFRVWLNLWVVIYSKFVFFDCLFVYVLFLLKWVWLFDGKKVCVKIFFGLLKGKLYFFLLYIFLWDLDLKFWKYRSIVIVRGKVFRMFNKLKWKWKVNMFIDLKKFWFSFYLFRVLWLIYKFWWVFEIIFFVLIFDFW